jgi:hypothetical protein
LSVKRIKSASLDYSTAVSVPPPPVPVPPRSMPNRARVSYFLGCIGIIILVLSILTVPMTLALPSSTEIRSIEIPTEDNDAWVSPRSKLGRFFSEWVGGGNRAQMVAEVSKPHIKRWHNRRRYRGVHH